MLARRKPISSRAPLKAKAHTSPVGSTTQRHTYSHTRDDIPRNVREAVARRSGGRCEAPEHAPDCDGRAAHMHHQLRRGQGGPHAATNLLAVSFTCHAFIHAHPARSYANGSLRSRWHLVAEEIS